MSATLKSGSRLVASLLALMALVSALALAQQFTVDDWHRVETIVGRIQGLSTSPPRGIISTKYTSGALLGNGDIGVVVGDTTTDRQRFWFGKSDFWGTHWNAKHRAPEASILSLGSLTLSSPDPTPDSGSAYWVDQDILHAQVTSNLKLGQALIHLRSWTADGENLFMTEITCDARSPAPARVLMTLSRASPDSSPHMHYPSAGGRDGGLLWATRENNLTGPSDYQARAAIVVRVLEATTAPWTAPPSSAAEMLVLKPNSHAWIAVSIKSDARIGAGGYSTEALKRAAMRMVRSITLPRVQELQAAHRLWWKRFWLRSYVDVHDRVLENFYYGSLYVLGSTSRPGFLPPSLWGNFITTDNAAWGGRYFMNYNEEAAYYGVFSSNHADLAVPYSRMVLAQFPFQKNRTAEAGYKGVSFQRTFTPFTTIAEPPPSVPVASQKNYRKLPSDQKSNATFSLLPVIQYYEYTQDRKCLRDDLYPAMKGLDAFWRDFAVRDPATGKWIFEHSSAHEGGDDVNPNLDIGYARRIETELIETSKVLGVDAAMRPVWREFLNNLSPYPTVQVNGKTVYAIAASIKNKIKDQGLFEPGDQPINLEGLVFPGENLSIGGDARQLQIARNSMQEMNSWGVTPGGNSHNGFCKIFPIAARIGWPADDLLDKFKAAIVYQWRPSNLTVFQGGGGIETAGSVEALDSMLLQHQNGVLRVFPDWPKDRDASFVRLRAKGAFLVSSQMKAGKVQWIDIKSERGGPLSLKSPWSAETIHCNGCVRKLLRARQGRILIQTKPGHYYRILPE